MLSHNSSRSPLTGGAGGHLWPAADTIETARQHLPEGFSYSQWRILISNLNINFNGPLKFYVRGISKFTSEGHWSWLVTSPSVTNLQLPSCYNSPLYRSYISDSYQSLPTSAASCFRSWWILTSSLIIYQNKSSCSSDTVLFAGPTWYLLARANG